MLSFILLALAVFLAVGFWMYKQAKSTRTPGDAGVTTPTYITGGHKRKRRYRGGGMINLAMFAGGSKIGAGGINMCKTRFLFATTHSGMHLGAGGAPLIT